MWHQHQLLVQSPIQQRHTRQALYHDTTVLHLPIHTEHIDQTLNTYSTNKVSPEPDVTILARRAVSAAHAPSRRRADCPRAQWPANPTAGSVLTPRYHAPAAKRPARRQRYRRRRRRRTPASKNNTGPLGRPVITQHMDAMIYRLTPRDTEVLVSDSWHNVCKIPPQTYVGRSTKNMVQLWFSQFGIMASRLWIISTVLTGRQEEHFVSTIYPQSLRTGAAGQTWSNSNLKQIKENMTACVYVCIRHCHAVV